MNRIISYVLLALLAMALQTQVSHAQDAILSQFFSSPMYLNPAFAGTENGYRMVTNFRSHPIPDASSFSTLSASMDVYAPSLYGGLGIIATSDYLGNMAWTNHIDAVYAVHLQLSRKWHMNFGAQAGYFRRDFRWGNLDFIDPGQPPPEHNYAHAPNFGAGLLAYNDRIYTGIAAHHLTEPKQSLFSDESLPRKYTAHLGLHLAPSKIRPANTLLVDFFVSPNIILQHQGGFNRINYGVYAGVESIVAGAWYRQNLDEPSAMIFVVGINRESLNLGYSYDYSLSGFTDVRHGIHEISISYILMTEEQERRARRLEFPRY